MNIGIEFGLTKLRNSSIEDVENINAFCNSLVNNINSKGINTTIFNIINETNPKLAEEKQLLKMNAIEMDLVISIQFNKEDSVVDGAFAYALGEEETIIAKNILLNLSPMIESKGVRVGNGKLILRGSTARTIILVPYNLISDDSISKLNQIGIDNVTNNIADSIINNIK